MNKVKEKMVGDVLVLAPEGSLDIMTYQKLKQRLVEALEKEKVTRMVINMAGVDYVASSGWAVLISQARRVKRVSGGLVLCNLKPEIRSIYETMSIETVLPSGASVKEALEMVDHA